MKKAMIGIFALMLFAAVATSCVSPPDIDAVDQLIEKAEQTQDDKSSIKTVQ